MASLVELGLLLGFCRLFRLTKQRQHSRTSVRDSLQLETNSVFQFRGTLHQFEQHVKRLAVGIKRFCELMILLGPWQPQQLGNLGRDGNTRQPRSVLRQRSVGSLCGLRDNPAFRYGCVHKSIVAPPARSRGNRSPLRSIVPASAQAGRERGQAGPHSPPRWAPPETSTLSQRWSLIVPASAHHRVRVPLC